MKTQEHQQLHQHAHAKEPHADEHVRGHHAGSNATHESAVETKDPVCGMNVDPASAAGSADYNGVTYHFCSSHCLAKFTADPEKYVPAVQNGASPRAHSDHAAHVHPKRHVEPGQPA